MESLSRDAHKISVYCSADVYFAEGLGDWTERPDVLHETALMVIKPEAVVKRAVEAILDAARHAGFDLSGVTTHQFTRHSLREMWRYQINQASSDRLTVIDRLLPHCPSLVLLLRRRRPDKGVPASWQLTRQKGPSNPGRRQPADLRHVVGAGPTILNYMHIADEQADVIRELAVLTERIPRQELLRQSTDVATLTVGVLTQHLYDITDPHDLDLDFSLERLHVKSGAAATAASLRALHDPGTAEHLWDHITVAVYGITADRPGAEPILTSATDLENT